MHLAVRARHRSYADPKPEAKIGISKGQLYVDSTSDTLANELREMVATEFFAEGRGFARFRRGALSGVLVRKSETNHVIFEGYVLLDNNPEDVLQAVRDNLEISAQFDVDVIR